MDTDQNSNVTKETADHVKSRGHFDKIRRECLTGIEDETVFINLRQRVEHFAERFLSKQRWHPQMNKGQLREKLREELTKAHFLQSGVRNIVEHIINSRKIQKQFQPIVEILIYEHFGIQPPNAAKPTSTDSQSSILNNVQSYGTAEQEQEEKIEPKSIVRNSVNNSATDTPIQDESFAGVTDIKAETILEQIDVDEGADMFVQCQLNANLIEADRENVCQ